LRIQAPITWSTNQSADKKSLGKEKKRKTMNRCMDIQKFRVPLLAIALFLAEKGFFGPHSTAL